ncbi:MAG: hypothetical protein OJF59_002231 [Cytophagales bacterium]|jgi:hypothetical protein|nr:MAG: hypothetical protein OJF59_002231 [Cytophagales bacterium]
MKKIILDIFEGADDRNWSRVKNAISKPKWRYAITTESN